jgi:hypothetical protein
MDCGKNVQRALWSDAFSFWSIRAFCGSFSMMVFTFADSHKYPAFVLVYAAAGQLYFFWRLGFAGVSHVLAIDFSIMTEVIKLTFKVFKSS